MTVHVTITLNPDELEQEGSTRTIFNLTKRELGYHHDDKFVLFGRNEVFYVMSEGINQWVVLVEDLCLTRIKAVGGRLHLARGAAVRGELLMAWERDIVSADEYFEVPVDLQDEWFENVKLRFTTRKQYDLFMDTHSANAGQILNRLYTSHEADGRVANYMSLAIPTIGPFIGEAVLVTGTGSYLLTYEDGEVFEDEYEFDGERSEGLIEFQLFFGQRRERVRTLKSQRLVRAPSTNVNVNGQEWIPQEGQIVRVEGVNDTFIIRGYNQTVDKFVLTLADPDKAVEDQRRHNASAIRKFMTIPTKLQPLKLVF